jgi:hypothetical protein
MMLWRAVLPSVCRSIAWVAMMTAGVVALAVSVEKVNQGWSTVCTAMQFQVVAALLWLSPLILATGVSLSGLRRRVRGEEQALASAGIGWPHLTPLVLTVGLVSGLVGLCVGEWLLPVVADPNLPGWVWTAVGPVRTADGLNVAIHAGGTVQFVDQVNVGEAFPRLASTSALFANDDVVARTELYARLARVLACVGCAWFGLVADRCRHPLIVVIGSTGLMMVLEAVAWGMAAQSQIPQWVGGGIPAILWVLPSLMCLRQPST